jgi:hypothetical protein
VGSKFVEVPGRLAELSANLIETRSDVTHELRGEGHVAFVDAR